MAGIKHGQVVVWLGQLGVIFSEFGERGDGFRRFVQITLDHPFEKTHLRVRRLGGQVAIHQCQGLGKLVGTYQLTDIGVFVCIGELGCTGTRQREQTQGFEKNRTVELHGGVR